MLDGWGSGGVAFLAYNPRDNLFYALNDSSVLKAYRISVSGSSVTASRMKEIPLQRGGAFRLQGWIQGGKISARGNLYVSVGGGGEASGLYFIDSANGYVQGFYPIAYGAASEFEGLDLWDLDVDQRIGPRGQLHLQQLHVDWPGRADDYWLAHYRFDEPGKL